jgi:hypothetical protein
LRREEIPGGDLKNKLLPLPLFSQLRKKSCPVSIRKKKKRKALENRVK